MASTGARSTCAATVSSWAESAVSSRAMTGVTSRSSKRVTSRVHGLSGWSSAASTVPSTSSDRPAAVGERVASTSSATTVWSAETVGASSRSSAVAAAAGDSPPMSTPATTVDLGMLPWATARSIPYAAASTATAPAGTSTARRRHQGPRGPGAGSSPSGGRRSEDPVRSRPPSSCSEVLPVGRAVGLGDDDRSRLGLRQVELLRGVLVLVRERVGRPVLDAAGGGPVARRTGRRPRPWAGVAASVGPSEGTVVAGVAGVPRSGSPAPGAPSCQSRVTGRVSSASPARARAGREGPGSRRGPGWRGVLGRLSGPVGREPAVGDPVG